VRCGLGHHGKEQAEFSRRHRREKKKRSALSGPDPILARSDREIGSETVPHIGEKEIQRIQRALDGLFGLRQAKPRAGVDMLQRLDRQRVPARACGLCDRINLDFGRWDGLTPGLRPSNFPAKSRGE
jgi:hypothetical protein